MGINTENGLVVIVGCSHIGIINILSTIIKRTDKTIYAVIGGSHLVDADEHRIQKTILALEEMNIRYIGVSHCTGDKGIKAIKEKMEEKLIINNTGIIMNFGD